MASRRTISYIGLWALIMPWLGFSWGTKTVLFSLTGLVLLFIGNRHYHSDKNKKNKNTSSQVETPIIKKEESLDKPVSTYEPIPEYMAPKTINSDISTNYTDNIYTNKNSDIYNTSEEIDETLNLENVSTAGNNVLNPETATIEVVKEKPKSRIRKKIEMAARPKRTSPKPITLDSLNTEYGEDQI